MDKAVVRSKAARIQGGATSRRRGSKAARFQGGAVSRRRGSKAALL